MMATGFEEETPIDLVGYLSIEDDHENRRCAQDEFYRRYARDLYNMCRKYARQLGDSGVEDLVADTIQRAFERADTFSGDDNWDEDRQRRQVLAWLGKIAHRLFLNTLRSANGREVLADLGEYSACNENTSPEMDDNNSAYHDCEQQRLVEAALAELPERERDILLETMRYSDTNRRHNRLPNAVSQELAARWQTTTDNVRQIRHRARKKIAAALNKEVLK